MINYLHKLVLLLALCSAASISVSAQTVAKSECPEEKVKAKEKAKPAKRVLPRAAFAFSSQTAVATVDYINTGETVEKSIMVDPKANISLCVALGNVEVRGWQRDEVRVLAEGGKIGFKIRSRNAENNPNALTILSFEPKPGAPHQNECLKAERITIEIPYTAFISIKNGSSGGGSISVDSVWKTVVSASSSDVELRNIAFSADVSTNSGNILAEDSSGGFNLRSFEGNIMAVRMRPNEFSDIFKLQNISGNIMLRDVSHKIIEARLASGSMSAMNSFVSGGSYDIQNQAGSMILELPKDFPFQLRATVGVTGNFKSDFLNKFTKEGGASGTSFVTGSNGAGDTPINLLTQTGVIYLKQKPPKK
jgi:hypothetical protein